MKLELGQRIGFAKQAQTTAIAENHQIPAAVSHPERRGQIVKTDRFEIDGKALAEVDR